MRSLIFLSNIITLCERIDFYFPRLTKWILIYREFIIYFSDYNFEGINQIEKFEIILHNANIHMLQNYFCNDFCLLVYLDNHY